MNSKAKIYTAAILLALLFVTGCAKGKDSRFANLLRQNEMKSKDLTENRPRARQAGVVVGVLPVEKTIEICRRYNALNWDKTLPPKQNRTK